MSVDGKLKVSALTTVHEVTGEDYTHYFLEDEKQGTTRMISKEEYEKLKE